MDQLIRDTLVFTAQKGWAGSGEPFTTALVTFLGQKLNVEYALVAELLPSQKRARTAGLFGLGQVLPDLEYDLNGTPCHNVMGKTLCCYPCGIQALFPEDPLLQKMGAESYLGIPLWDSIGLPLGLIAIMGQRPLENREEAEAVLQVVAIRCAHELEQRRTEEIRRGAEQELLRYQKLESMGALAGRVAHDMNNVLATILGVTNVLQESCRGQQTSIASLDLILKAMDRGRALMNDLSGLAQGRTGDHVPVDVNGLLEQEAKRLGKVRTPQTQILCELASGLPKIQGEAAALATVLSGLGANALEAMPEGGTLTLQSRATEDGRIQVIVQDTGQGMTPEVLARATEPYFSTKRSLGLGLALARTTLKVHHGELVIESEPEHGTCITLSFPPLPEEEPAEPPTPTPAARRRALRVLMVDDEELLLAATSALLEVMGHKAETASNGPDALTKLQAGLEVDVVILDLFMPGMNGLETLKELRRLKPALPVVISSGFLQPEAIREAKALPRVATLPKPYGPEELRNAILGALSS